MPFTWSRYDYQFRRYPPSKRDVISLLSLSLGFASPSAPPWPAPTARHVRWSVTDAASALSTPVPKSGVRDSREKMWVTASSWNSPVIQHRWAARTRGWFETFRISPEAINRSTRNKVHCQRHATGYLSDVLSNLSPWRSRRNFLLRKRGTRSEMEFKVFFFLFVRVCGFRWFVFRCRLGLLKRKFDWIRRKRLFLWRVRLKRN